MPTKFKLLKVSGVKEEWEPIHKIRALEINGKCPVNTFLERLKNANYGEYKKIFKVLKLIGSNDRIKNSNYVKPHKKHTGIYELVVKKGFSRISFFYYESINSNIVCITPFRKEKDYKPRKQDLFFDRSAEIMDKFLTVATHRR